LQAVIGRALATRAATSAGGVAVSWGEHGTVSFRPARGGSGSFGMRPVSIGRSGPEAVSPGPFVFGRTATTEALGYGLRAWYRASALGLEQGFTVSRRPAGAAESFTIVLGASGDMRARATGAGRLTISGRTGPPMSYGPVQATDARGRALHVRVIVAGTQVRVAVNDVDATYPLTIAGVITEAPAVAATFAGSASEDLGYSVVLSAGGRVALVGADKYGSGDGAAYVYTETAGGSWSTTPVATFTGSGGEGLGSSVALSADGQTALVGAPYYRSSGDPGPDGAAYLYSETGGTWSATPVATFTGSSLEQLGRSVALSADGQVAVVGAPGYVSGSGAAYVYTDAGGSWSTAATMTAAGLGVTGLGFAVALSADGGTALVGAPDDGDAYVYSDAGGSWSTAPVATFRGTDNDALGYSVALSADGQVALVSVPSRTSSDANAAYVYTDDGGAWSTAPAETFTLGTAFPNSVALSADGQTAAVGTSSLPEGLVFSQTGGSWSAVALEPPGSVPGSGGGFGWSMALSADGQTILTSAPGAGTGGEAYVYTTTTLQSDDDPAASFAGSSGGTQQMPVALSADGQTAVVGAPGAGSGNQGAAYVYSETAGTWSANPTATFTGTDGEQFGSSVAISADGETVLSGGNGVANVYTSSGGIWASNPVASFDVSGAAGFGCSVALSADGRTALVGAKEAGGTEAGAAYLYTEVGGSWSTTPSATFTGYDPSGDFGASVALSADGQTALVGAPQGGGAPSEYGGAFLYGETGGSWPTSPTAAFSQGAPGDLFGYSVALSADGQTALVGAPGQTAISFMGGAFLYTETGGSWPAVPYAFDSWGAGTGTSVALSADGQTALVGAPDTDLFAGAAYLYNAAEGVWTSLPAASFAGGPNDWFGGSVALSADGQTVLAGGPRPAPGHAYLYTNVATAPTVTVYVSGYQAYGSSSPTFSHDDDIPTTGVEVGGALTCSEVEPATPDLAPVALDATLGVGTYTVDGDSCDGLYVTGAGSFGYALRYVGSAYGFDVMPAQSSSTPGGGSSSSTPGGGSPGGGSPGGGSPGGGSPASGSTSSTVPAGATSQTISFTAPSLGAVGRSATLAATGGASGNPVVFSVDASSGKGVCDVSGTDGTTVTYTAPGDCVIDANQAGNASYSAAPEVQQTTVVVVTKGRAVQRITFAPIAGKTVAQSPVTVRAAASSGLAVTFSTTTPSVCIPVRTKRGVAITLLRVGTCTVRASQAGNARYEPATPVSRSFEVSKASQTITFVPITGKTLAQSPVTVRAVASSGLVVTIGTSTPSVCTPVRTRSGTRITLHEAGICSVRASQAGNVDYGAARRVSRSFRVSR
jgi:hypothetical protein